MGRAAGRPRVALRSGAGPAVRAKSRLSDGLSEWVSERSSVAVPMPRCGSKRSKRNYSNWKGGVDCCAARPILPALTPGL